MNDNPIQPGIYQGWRRTEPEHVDLGKPWFVIPGNEPDPDYDDSEPLAGWTDIGYITEPGDLPSGFLDAGSLTFNGRDIGTPASHTFHGQPWPAGPPGITLPATGATVKNVCSRTAPAAGENQRLPSRYPMSPSVLYAAIRASRRPWYGNVRTRVHAPLVRLSAAGGAAL